MEYRDYIALGALAFSIFAMVVSFMTSTKKYELTAAQRSEILRWYRATVEVLIGTREHLSAGTEFNKADCLGKLSALIELGRFYFPNIIKKDGFGSGKPSAYQGYREATIEFLVFSYDIIKQDNAQAYINHLYHLQRRFTARLFDVLSPRKYNKLVKRHTLLTLDKGMNSIEFMESNPELYFTFHGAHEP